MKKIETRADVEAGLLALRGIDPRLCATIDGCGEVPLRLRAPGFHGLAEIVTSQQVSKASAAAIFGRLTAAIDPFDAETFLAAGEAPLIEAGLSRAKQVTLTGLAHAISEDGLDLENLAREDAETAMARLVALKGIGPWTAEVFLLFCAGHPDIFPAGDIALQHAVGDVHRLDESPGEKETRALAEAWTPHRGVAARLMWAHYAVLKGGRTAVPV